MNKHGLGLNTCSVVPVLDSVGSGLWFERFCVSPSEDDPDYDFLLEDLSSSETLPPLPPTSTHPPTLPEKRRRSNAGGDSPDPPVCLSVCPPLLSSVFLNQVQPALRARPPLDLTPPLWTRAPPTVMRSQVLMNRCPPLCPPARHLPRFPRRSDTVSRNAAAD